jgi:hypothetical protein
MACLRAPPVRQISRSGTRRYRPSVSVRSELPLRAASRTRVPTPPTDVPHTAGSATPL